MKNHQKKSTDPMEYEYLKAASFQDCTGLIPAAPADDTEVENYEELYPFLPKVLMRDESENNPE